MDKIYKVKPLYIKDSIPVFTDIETRYIKNYDKIADVHLSELKNTKENPFGNNAYTKLTTENYLVYINRYIKGVPFVLDAGIGTGDITHNLNTPNKFGVDISIEYLKIAKSKNIDVCLALLEKLPYRSNMFDVVLCRDVFEHVLQFYDCIKEILRVLKPNGKLIFQVPYKQDLNVFLNYTDFEYVHLRNFDEASIILLFEKIFGCKVLEYYICTCDFFTNCDMIDVVVQKLI